MKIEIKELTHEEASIQDDHRTAEENLQKLMG